MYLDAERAIIGTILTEANAFSAIAQSLDADDFVQPICHAAFKAALRCESIGLTPDIVSISEALKEEGCDPRWLTELMDIANSVFGYNLHPQSNMYLLREARIKRDLISLSGRLTEAAESDQIGNAEHLLADAASSINIISRKVTTATDTDPIQVITEEFIAETELRIATPVRYTGCHTGFQQLDELTNGWKPGELIIVAARPSMGKSAFMMASVHSIAIQQQKPTIIFSLEMDRKQLIERLISQMTLIDSRAIQRGHLNTAEMDRVRAAARTIGTSPLFIHDDIRCTPAKARAISNRLFSRVGELGLICVDYLQIMGSGLKQNNHNRTEEVSHLSREMKALAREFEVPVMALSQLSRTLEQRQDKRPILSDLRESGSIEQDADVVAFLYRDEYYNKNTNKLGIAEFIISKQRSGPLGAIDLLWRPQYSQFIERPVTVPTYMDPYENRYGD